MMQRTVKINITRHLKTQGVNTLNSSDLRESWKFIKAVTHTTTRKNKTQADCTELNEYFARIVNTTNPIKNSIDFSSCKPEDGFSVQEIPAHSVIRQLLQMKVE